MSLALAGCSVSVGGRTDGAAEGAVADGVTPGTDDAGPSFDAGGGLPDGLVVGPDGGSVVPDDVATSGPDAVVVGRDGGGARPDAPVVVGTVGTPCENDTECPGLFCSRRGSGFGYCSWVCNAAMPCPGDSVCARFARESVGYCMPRCDPRASTCAPGTVCQPGIADVPVCYPGCADDTDCAMGQRCGRGAGGGTSCYTPSAAAGAACTATAECPVAGYCLDERSWGVPRGACVTFCELATLRGCDPGSTCVAWGARGAGSCVPTCDATRPCRAGYACVPTPTAGVSACVPRCTGDADCSDGRTCSFVTGRCGTGG